MNNLESHGSSFLGLSLLFYIFVHFNGKVGAHPSTNAASITLLLFDKGGQQVSLGIKFVPGYLNASPGAESHAITTPLAKHLIDNYLTLWHVFPPF
jgi:hypothetical protein